MDKCIICSSAVDPETAHVLEMGAYGNPKYLCDECSSLLDTATSSASPDEIDESVKAMAEKVSESDISEKTFATIDGILTSAVARSEAIRRGEYDFSEDNDGADDGFDEIPDELRETDEDRELDRRDEEYTEKFNKVFDYVTFALAIGIGIFIIWKLVDTFLI